MPARSSWVPRTRLPATQISRSPAGTSTSLGSIKPWATLPLATALPQAPLRLSTPALTKGTLTLNGDIAFKGTSAHTTPPATLAVNVSLAGGTHNITVPSGFGYSNSNYDLVQSVEFSTVPAAWA